MKQEMQLKEQKLRERELDGTIRSAMGDKFDGDMADYTIRKIRDNLVEQDGEFIVVNGRNQQRFTQDGNPMTIRDLVEEIGRTNPKLLRQVPPSGGSGLRPNTSYEGIPGDNEIVPDYSKDPASFNNWAQKRGLGRGMGLKGVQAQVFRSSGSSKVF
jgi:hypothetical protein